MNLNQWIHLMNRWHFPAANKTYRALVRAYSQKHRHYHTVTHVQSCLGGLDDCRDQTQHPHEVELALWFHDAVYNPLSSQNEQKSADWAAAFLDSNAAATDAIDRVQGLITATRHDAPPQTRDESLLVDIDLSVLGENPDVYGVFEKAVRNEYRIVPAFLYRKKRIEVLNGFLKRPHIYQNEPFKSRYEAQARINLANAISELRVI